MLIQDDALRSVIARTLRVKEEELNEDLMKELTHLEVQDHEIETLEGLQYAENLETLNASNNKLQTLDPIKEIIAWGFDTGATRELAETTLSKLAGLGPALLHSDQGTVYTAPLYRDLAKSLNIDLSYSRKGNCFGNACMENFYGHLKSETIYQMPKNRCYVLPRADLKQIIDKYIRWYNKERVSGEIRVPFPCKLLKI